MISENTILKELSETQKITQCRNSSKSHRTTVERAEIDTPNTHTFCYLFYISDLFCFVLFLFCFVFIWFCFVCLFVVCCYCFFSVK